MKTEIDTSIIEAALIKLGEATARQISDDVGLEARDVTRTLNTMLKVATVEREKRANEYVYWLTIAAATPAPASKPRAAAVAVHAAIEGGTDPAPDLAEQLRQAHAERLAMSQTIISICCAIGRDPGQTTTAELQQAVKDAITEARNSGAHEMAVALGKIRKAIGDDTNEIDLHALDLHIGHDYTMAKRDMQEHRDLREALVPITDELFEYYQWYELPWAVRIMGQPIDAQHAHLHAQALQIEHLKGELAAQSTQHQAETGLLADKNAKLHAEIEHLRNQPTPLRLPAPEPTPDAYLVTRYVRAGHGKTRAHPGGPTRHKKLDTATRKARAAIRGGYVRAEIHATNLVAVATFGAEIKPV